MKKITKRKDPEEFTGWLNQIIKYYDISRTELIKAAGIKDESFLESYLNGSNMQVTDTQNKIYQGCAKIVASILDSGILNAGISYDYIAQALGVSRTTIDNYIHHYEEISDPFKKFEQIKAVIESSQYYMGFKRLSDEEFAKFFDKNDVNTLGKLWKKNGLSIEKINSDLGLTKNNASFVRNNQQHLSTRKQYDILSKAYDMCMDYTCQYYEGFEDIGKKLHNMLNQHYNEDFISNFSDVCSKLKKLLKLDTDELYSILKKHYSEEEFTISRKAFEFLCTNNTFYWDIKEKALICEYIFQTDEWKQAEEKYKTACSKCKPDREESKIISKFGPLDDIYRNLNDIRDGTEEKKWAKRLKDLSDDLKQYPLETQKIILSHANVFLDIDLKKAFKNARFGSYYFHNSTSFSYIYDQEKALRSINSGIFYYLDAFINYFRELSDYSQCKIIDVFSKEVPIYFNLNHSEFEYFSQCFDMIIKSHEISLTDTDSPPPKPSDYFSMKKTDRKFWKHYDKEKIKARVQYTPCDWNFMAILLLMMDKEKDLSNLVQKMDFMYEIEHDYDPTADHDWEDEEDWDDMSDDDDDDFL